MGEGKALDNATFTRTTLLGGCVAHAIDPTAARSMFCNAALFLGSAVGETCRPGHGNLSASPGKTALTSSDTPSLALFTVKMIQLKVSGISFQEINSLPDILLTWSADVA